MPDKSQPTAEALRLAEESRRERNWKRWGPYLSERQWGTVREDYSPFGDSWGSFPHDHARSRAYRWGEDGLLGFCDRQCRLCFAVALHNGADPILKERLFGLTGPEGNHGEDVKESYYYLASTPTHSYAKALYKYPQGPYPYARLVEENRRRGYDDRELELADTGVFDANRYFDVFVEYAKASPNDILIRLTVANRGPERATVHVLPTLWYRNTWGWGRVGEGYLSEPPLLEADGDASVRALHPELGAYRFDLDAASDGTAPALLFTCNETNHERLHGTANRQPYVKDAFHRHVVDGEQGAVDPSRRGTKAAGHYVLEIDAGAEVQIDLRLYDDAEAPVEPFGKGFERVLERRIAEHDAFYERQLPPVATPDERVVLQQAYAGLLWTKQFYHYVVEDWLRGDPGQPPPSPSRHQGRNRYWANHLYNRDIISMPDKWEYPWYAAWDLAFHMIPFAEVDPWFAKDQIELFLREWYMHPSGQIPAYEFELSDVNPPVHAWAAWRIYKLTSRPHERDRMFLSHVFQKLLMNFTWWVNRKDSDGNNMFSGGFLGLDNIGVFDRSRPLPTGGELEQTDGTAWMAFYCGTMVSMAIELARQDPASEDLASKFFEHFVAIAHSINQMGGSGLWDEEDGFYYDRLLTDHTTCLLKVRSMVGIIPLFATEVLSQDVMEQLPGFLKRMQWFLRNKKEVVESILDYNDKDQILLALVPKDRLVRILRYVLDEAEFLSPYGVRSLSKVHDQHPFVLQVAGDTFRVDYVSGESTSGMFGGNSNWRGPVWFPLNYLLLEAIERYAHFYPELKVECPTGSGQMLTLQEVADEICMRLSRLFLRDDEGRRPAHGREQRYADDPHFRDLVLFYEYFDGDDGRGLGASHQTGWTALVARCIAQVAERRAGMSEDPDR